MTTTDNTATINPPMAALIDLSLPDVELSLFMLLNLVTNTSEY